MTVKVRPEVLDKIRDEQELNSDEALARFLDLSLRTVQGIRHGKTPSLPTFVRIMNAANIKNMRAAIIQEQTNAA